LRETEPLGSPIARSSGRPGLGLVLNTRDEFFIGVNIGVRRSHIGAVTVDGRVIAEEVFDTPGDAREALRLVRSSVLGLCARAGGGSLSVIGVSVPGPTCAERRRLLYAPHLGWRDVAIADALQGLGVEDEGDLADMPVIVENDATAAAMFEACTRLSKETREEWRNFALVRAGTGIGVGLVLDGEVYRGAGANGGWAGEFGHMTIVADGKACPCGNRGCWERYASASSAALLYTGDRAAARSSAPRFIEIVARAGSGERRAQATLEQVGHYLGIGVANVMSGLGVSRVVVSGRVVHGWKFMREALQKAVRRSMAGRLAQWSVVAGKATGAGLGGAIEVAVDQYWKHLAG
jgi:predicted NBD/HSP70 family sugar kinase